jgi:cation transport ATPase
MLGVVVDMTTGMYPVTGCAGDVRGFYQVLGVARTATTDEINKARKRELRAWHPDHADEHERDECGRRATLINEAADTLVDPVRRYRYDHTEFRDPREDDRRREQAAAQAEQAAAQAEQARRATAEQARRDQQAAAEAAARRRRAAAEQAQREADEAAEAERKKVRLQRKRQVAHALWCLAYLALVPQLAFRQLFIPVVDVYINVLWTSTLVLVLALAHLWIGAATRVFAFQSERSRVGAGAIVVLQIAVALVLLFLAPAILLLIELLKVVALLLGILVILMLLSS